MIKRELAIFLVVGILTVLIDFAIYRSLVWAEVVGLSLAKTAGFLAGTLFAYFANRFWTFGHRAHVTGSAWRFGFLYALTLGANVATNSMALTLIPYTSIAFSVAFLLATGVSAALNFVGMKLFVFKAALASEVP